MTKSVAEKMGIREGARTFFVNAPAESVEAIDLPPLERIDTLTGEFDYIHFFAKSQQELNETFPKLKPHLKATGSLWVSWAKSGKLGTDLTLPKVIEIGYNHGLVESKALSIDSTWSGLKFTHPKAGKVYNNSFGKLKTK